jgi:hypothetical protein
MLPGFFEAALTAKFPRPRTSVHHALGDPTPASEDGLMAPGAAASSRPGSLRSRRVRAEYFSTLL